MRAGLLALLGIVYLCVGAPRAFAQAVKIPVTGEGYGTSADVILLEEVRNGKTIHLHEICNAHYVYYLHLAPGVVVPLPMTMQMDISGKYDLTYSGPVSAFGWQLDPDGNRIEPAVHASGWRRLGPDGLWRTEWHASSASPTGIMFLRETVTMPDLYNFTSAVEGMMLMTPPMTR